MAKIRRTDPVAQVTGTNNRNEQAAQFQSLVQLANAPVMVVVITFDSRNQRVDAKLVGAEAPNQIVQQVLDAAKNLFNQQEIAKQVQLAKEAPDGSHGKPVGPMEPEVVPDIPPVDVEGVPDAE